jgi:hypothetical protein
MTEITLVRIEKEVERLTLEEQLNLLERLVHRIRKVEFTTKKKLDWKELYGLGKNMWKGEDAQDYVNHLREDRV